MTDQDRGSERRMDPRVEWDGEVVLEIGNQRIKCKGVDLSQSLVVPEETPELLGLSHTKVLGPQLMELFADWPHVRDLQG